MVLGTQTLGLHDSHLGIIFRLMRVPSSLSKFSLAQTDAVTSPMAMLKSQKNTEYGRASAEYEAKGSRGRDCRYLIAEHKRAGTSERCGADQLVGY
jgi:hypothetical protein